jgi:transcriptional regulator with GAF, ATPase, and Fis domain
MVRRSGHAAQSKRQGLIQMGNPNLIGSSPKFRAVLDKVSMVGPVDSSVLVHGETGTGKELIAQAIHASSPRRQQRLIAINCAAIPTALLESELFGHERGAFTGAVCQTVGRFQAADHGTLFLDEIGELPLELQPKLLRALQERQIERLGSMRTHNVDVRIIAATNQDLEQLVHKKKFRADLYYRLNVFPIALPPLRERQEDIPLLAEHFVQQFSQRYGKSICHIPNAIMDFLKGYDWPGNIRELQNFMERSVILTPGSVLHAPFVQLARQGEVAEVATRVQTLADAERAHITATLHETNGVVIHAAARLGIPRTTLISKMRRLGLSKTSQPKREQQMVDLEPIHGPLMHSESYASIHGASAGRTRLAAR